MENASDQDLQPVTLDDLLKSESAVLQRIGLQVMDGPTAGNHNSSTSGHNSGGSHQSHTSAKTERPFGGD
jgi:hypothetical protein